MKLGNKVRDRISGAEGIVVGVHDWPYGCRTVTVKATKAKEDGTPGENMTFDEPQVEVIGEGLAATAHVVAARAKAPTGGPDRPVARGREVSRQR